MCIRFQLDHAGLIKWSKQVRAWVPLEDWTEGKDLFPGYVAPILMPDWSDQGRVFARAQWGMIPPWAKDARFGKTNAYNARGETVLEKPTFRTAFQKRRCIVPISCFYDRLDGRWIRFDGPEIMACAGLYEPPNQHAELPTFTMVTSDPNDVVSPVQDRMPVILTDKDMERWLDPSAEVEELRAMLVPCPNEWLRAEDAGPIEGKRSAPKATTSSLFDQL